MNVWHNMRCPIYANNISALNDTIKYMARTESYLFYAVLGSSLFLSKSF